jgi:hypothetical protein
MNREEFAGTAPERRERSRLAEFRCGGVLQPFVAIRLSIPLLFSTGVPLFALAAVPAVVAAEAARDERPKVDPVLAGLPVTEISVGPDERHFPGLIQV